MKAKKTYTSMNDWRSHYLSKGYKEDLFKEIKEDPEKLGAALANSTVDRLLSGKTNLTRRSRGRS